MGQRLTMMVYEHRKDEEPFAAVYLYWSAYSFSALEEAAFLLQHLTGKNCQTKEEWKKEIVTAYMQRKYDPFYLEIFPDRKERHGGIYQEDNALAQRMWPDWDLDVENVDRSLGLVAISKNGIEALQKCSEGEVRIYLDTMSVDNDVFFQSPVSAWTQGKDGNWRFSDADDEDLYISSYISDKTWQNLSEIKTAGLSLSDITKFLEGNVKKVSEDGFALTDSGHTVVEIIQ